MPSVQARAEMPESERSLVHCDAFKSGTLNYNFQLDETVLPSGECVENCIVQTQCKMDAIPFNGAANTECHGRNHRKLPNSSVDTVFESILDGDVSEAELPDDELVEEDHAASESWKLRLLLHFWLGLVGLLLQFFTFQVAIAEDELRGESGSACSDEEASDNMNEKAAPKKKKETVTWNTGPFNPKDSYCSYKPRGRSTPAEPLVNFQQYFSDGVFEELAMYTHIYALQATGVELNCTKKEMNVF
ncbi:hypothetical protein MTO96_032555 [Rhipicephalus appendiculatus]